jgi:branched-subunit amino acid aminotransferase/4-amino-4-deoxychorismate lyase
MEMNFLLTPEGWLSSASIPLQDRGFRYGMHVFETIFSRSGEWEDWSHHIEALHFHGQQVGFQIFDEAWKYLQSPPLVPSGPLRARLYWTAGSGSPLDPPTPGLMAFSTEPIPASEMVDPPPLHITISDQLLPQSPLPAKSGNYWLRLSILQQAINAGFNEALVFNSSGHWLGFCCGNGFARFGQEWVTPALATGTRRGVTRGKVLLRCPQIQEVLLTKDELASAESLVFASARHGLRTVARLENCTLSQVEP